MARAVLASLALGAAKRSIFANHLARAQAGSWQASIKGTGIVVVTVLIRPATLTTAYGWVGAICWTGFGLSLFALAIAADRLSARICASAVHANEPLWAGVVVAGAFLALDHVVVCIVVVIRILIVVYVPVVVVVGAGFRAIGGTIRFCFAILAYTIPAECIRGWVEDISEEIAARGRE